MRKTAFLKSQAIYKGFNIFVKVIIILVMLTISILPVNVQANMNVSFGNIKKDIENSTTIDSYINSRNYTEPVVLGDKLFVIWGDWNNGSYHTTVVNKDGTLTQLPNVVISPRANDNTDTVLYKGLTNGNILVYWYSESAGTGFTDTYFKIINQSGTEVVPATKINSASGSLNRFTEVAQLSNGNLAFVWATDGTNYALRRFTTSGTPVDASQLSITSLAGITGLSQYTHKIAADSAGRFMVMFSYYNPNYMGMIFANDSTTPIQVNGQNAFVIANRLSDGDAMFQFKTLANGKFLTVYRKQSTSGSSNTHTRNIYYRLYNADGTPYTNEVMIRQLHSWGEIKDIFVTDNGYFLSYFYKDSTIKTNYYEYYDNEGVFVRDYSADFIASLPTLISNDGFYAPFKDIDGNISFIINDTNGRADYDLWLLRSSQNPVSPDAPTSVTATAGNGQAVVNFTAPINDGGSAITGYTVKVYTGGVEQVALAKNGTTSPITVTGLTNGTAYTFKVIAKNSVGDSTESTATSAVTPIAPATAPDVPTSVTATAGNGQAVVNFTAPINDGGSAITGYTVKVYIGGTEQPALAKNGTASPITVTGLTNGTAYTFKVIAKNSVGDSAESVASSVVTPIAPATVPDVPTSVTATAGNGQAVVNFTAPINDGGSPITGYTVKVYAGGVEQVALAKNGTASPITVTGLTNGTAYTFKVIAKNSVGDSTESTATSAVTPIAPATVPDVPTSVTATAGNGQAVVNFTAPTNDGGSPITGYTVKVYIGGTEQPALAKNGTTSPITVTGLTNGTAYTFKVIAKNSVGDSTESTASSVVTPIAPATAPDAPTSVTATAGNGQAVVNFTAPINDGGSPITGYTVKVYTGGVEQVALAKNGTASPITVTGLTNGTAYTFKVIAKNSVGDSTESTASSAVTPIAPATVPDVPTSVTATAGNGQAVVNFTAPTNDGGSPITGYTVKVYTGGVEQVALAKNGTASPITVTGLTNGTAYTFKVIAKNSVGDSTESTASSAVTPIAPMTVPDAPTNVMAVGGNGQAIVSFDAPMNDGGSPITSYTVKVYTGGMEQPALATNGPTSPIMVTGLTNGTDYTFTVIVTNSVGDSLESLASVVITPNPAPLTDDQAVAQAALILGIGYATGDSATIVTQPLTLPTIGIEQTIISWSSSNVSIIQPDGMVIRPSYVQGDQPVTLTATIVKGSAVVSKNFTIHVKALSQTDMEAVTQAKEALEIGYTVGDSVAHVTNNLQLLTNGQVGTTISWLSSNPLVVQPNGNVIRPLINDSVVMLTATITKGNVTDTKSFVVTVKGMNIPTIPEITQPSIGENTSVDDNDAINSTSEQFMVDVQSGDGQGVSKTVVNRTRYADGTVQDRVTLTSQSVKEALEKLGENDANIIRIMLPTDAANRVQQTDIIMEQIVLALLKVGQVHLEIVADGSKIIVPQNSLQSFDQELYFRIMPVKAQTTKQQLEERAKAEASIQQLTNTDIITLLGQPMTIETNMQNRPVTLTLPLPQNVTQEQLDNLAVYIEHSDGTKEVVRGQVVDFKAGTKGIQFEVTKFSTFSILYAPVKQEQPKEEVVVEEQISTPYIKGYADGTFRPEASVTRAQMASMMARYVTDNEIPEATATFTDTATHDAKDAIEFVKETGLFKGTTETTFNPNGSITRAQMATVVARWLAENGEVANSQAKAFKDVSNNYWAAEAIAVVSAQGIMTGTSTTTFNPEGYLTRAQAVKVLNRLFERQVTATEQAPLFTDVPSNHWAFDEIQAAAK
ncbi:fibronectin type III domain-containing protein [Lysinibacillus piscis]|uniref:Fibronectin type III domain-containing protein n=1 Tax=Lysinibacillus piscis TaxID=2518931 RepID=A0ABQ5NHG4_9BACI|nr:fibronectin type III domain-containing protein [Lysinibacillus sp. KH24]GLC87728.1 hypothetical protein LYSBPC_08550 [Lysinibacillus sp. KH24]